MAVKTHEADIGHSPSRAFYGGNGFLSTQGKSKFGIELACLDISMGIGLYAGGDPH